MKWFVVLFLEGGLLLVFQSLLLLTYLVKNGSERVVTNTRDHIYDLRQLENFSFFDEYGKDQGVNSMYNVYLSFILTGLQITVGCLENSDLIPPPPLWSHSLSWFISCTHTFILSLKKAVQALRNQTVKICRVLSFFYRSFSVTWSVALQIAWNKRKF